MVDIRYINQLIYFYLYLIFLLLLNQYNMKNNIGNKIGLKENSQLVYKELFVPNTEPSSAFLFPYILGTSSGVPTGSTKKKCVETLTSFFHQPGTWYWR